MVMNSQGALIFICIINFKLNIIKKIDTGNVDFSDMYIDFVIKMHNFLQELSDFSKLISMYKYLIFIF